MGFPRGSAVKNSRAMQKIQEIQHTGPIPGSETSPGRGNGNPIQYSCLKNSIDRRSWWATVHRATKSQTGLKQLSRHCNTILSSVQSLSCVQLFVTPWTVARQASLSITNSQSLLKLTSIKSVMPSNHLILCHPFSTCLQSFPSIRVFSNESVLCIRWLKY